MCKIFCLEVLILANFILDIDEKCVHCCIRAISDTIGEATYFTHVHRIVFDQRVFIIWPNIKQHQSINIAQFDYDSRLQSILMTIWRHPSMNTEEIIPKAPLLNYLFMGSQYSLRSFSPLRRCIF